MTSTPVMRVIYDNQWNKIMVVAIQYDVRPLYFVDSAYFPKTDSVQLSEIVGQAEGTAFAGFVDQKDQGVQDIKGQEAQQEQHEKSEDPGYDSGPDRHWW